MVEIASLCGFTGTSYMSECFKKFFGSAPRDYRKEWKQNISNLDLDTAK